MFGPSIRPCLLTILQEALLSLLSSPPMGLEETKQSRKISHRAGDEEQSWEGGGGLLLGFSTSGIRTLLTSRQTKVPFGRTPVRHIATVQIFSQQK